MKKLLLVALLTSSLFSAQDCELVNVNNYAVKVKQRWTIVSTYIHNISLFNANNRYYMNINDKTCILSKKDYQKIEQIAFKF